MWHLVGGEHSLKISAPQILRFGIDSFLNILNERITQLINEWINYEGVYRTAPATPGLLTTLNPYIHYLRCFIVFMVEEMKNIFFNKLQKE